MGPTMSHERIASGLSAPRSRNHAGTLPQIDTGIARSGRWKLVKGTNESFLYVPEAQSIFTLPGDIAPLFSDHDSSDHDRPYELFREYISHLISLHKTPLNTQRSTKSGLKTLVIHVCQICNLDCIYCYAHELNKANKTMSEEVAAAVLRQVETLAPTGIENVKFLGGEPTLAWDTVEFFVEGFNALAVRKNWAPPSFVMVSNGTGINVQRANYISSKRFKVLISVDGEAPIHNALRPRKGGQASHQSALDAVELLINAGVNTAIEAVYTKDHFRSGITPNDMIDYFTSIGVTEFQITPAVGTWHNEELIHDIEAVSDLFESMVRRCVRSLAGDDPIIFRGIQFVLDGFVLREKRSHVCGAGRDFMAINYNGEAFPCYLLESASLSYGFVTGRGIEEPKYESIRTRFKSNGKAHHPVCRKCWANEICQSCLGTTFQIEPAIAKPPAWFCGFQKRLISAALGELAGALASENRHKLVANMQESLQDILRDGTHAE
jgi:uncharacterized protein